MNNEYPLVSAVITTYKRKPAMLRRAIESVLSQTYTNLELIVVDDSPADYEYRADVKTFCEGYGERLRYIPHATNQGACAARNTGIDAANGVFIGFLDDDDEWLPTKIEKQIKLFDSDKIGLVYCGNYIIDESKNLKYLQNRQYVSGDIFDEIIRGNFIGSTSCPLLRRDVVIEVGMFDVEMPATQDLDLWLRILEKYEATFVEEPLVNYWVHNEEKITQNSGIKVKALKRIIDKNHSYLVKHPRIYSIRLLHIASAMNIGHDKKGAFRYWRKAFWRYPFPNKLLIKTALKIVFTRKTKGK